MGEAHVGEWRLPPNTFEHASKLEAHTRQLRPTTLPYFEGDARRLGADHGRSRIVMELGLCPGAFSP